MEPPLCHGNLNKAPGAKHLLGMAPAPPGLGYVPPGLQYVPCAGVCPMGPSVGWMC